MKKRKRSRIPSRKLYCIQKRFLAFLLAAVMILTNVGADMNQVFAASSSESVTFSMSGSQLIKAIEDGIANGDEVTAEDLDFTNGKIAEFKKLFFGEGKIYEAFPEPQGESMDAELRVFVRVPENADDMYMVTGEEEIIFLYVNNGENTISCTTEITRMDDGAEKVKRTSRITVRSYEAAYGDEKVDVVSKPAETTVPEETKKLETEKATVPAGTENPVETAPPQETTSTPVETTSAPEETQAELPEETAAASEESQKEAPAEETAQEAIEPEEIPAPEAETSEPVASIIRHNVPVVAANENGYVTETAEAEVNEETAAAEPENEEKSKETGALETEKETEVETKQAETTQAETTQAETTQAETTQAETVQAETTQAETTQAETTQAETTQAETTQVETTQAETTQAPVDKKSAETVSGVASPSEIKPAAETPKSETGTSAAGTADLVGMGYCSTAKAYTVTINQLKAFEDYDGYKISYTVYPEASARIIEGPRGVEEGQELTFGVKNQIGYAIESVTANTQTLNPDSVTDNNDGSQTSWYSVPEIYEDHEVEVFMTETGEHPEFSSELAMKDGTVIRLYAPEGVLPKGVKATASVVTGIGDAVKEKVEAEAAAKGEDKEVIGSLSYNIDLLDYNGNKLDNQIWNGAVQVTFSGTPMEEHSKEADTVEVVYVATTKEEEPQADVSASDVTYVEPVSEELNIEKSKSIHEITFEAEHFSTYTIVFYNFFGNKLVPLNIVKYDNGVVEPIGTDAKRYTAFDSNRPVSIKDIAPDVSGYTFEKATIGSNYVSGDVIQDLKNEADFLWNTLKYKTSSSGWIDVDENNIYLWYMEAGITVQFNANGGQGTVSSQNVKPGDSIELPDGSGLKKADYQFIGWSESPDGGKITAKGNAGYNEVYTDTFTINASETAKTKTLYAVWAQTGGNATGRLWVAVLNDGGDLPAEPRNQTSRSYEFIYKDYGQFYKTIGLGDNLLNYINPLITVTGKDNVQANLNSKFYQVTDDWTKRNLKDNEYIEWYVIKYESAACGTEGWHVDGIIRNNESYYVDYDGNGNTGGLTPDGQGYDLDENVTVAKAGGYESGTWLPLKKDGYVFNGWNTRSDGSGVAFNEGGSFRLTEEFIAANHSGTANTVTLYAQWRLKNSVQIKFQAVGGGKVSPANEYLNPDIGVSKGATATANTGYKLSGWYSDKACTVPVSTADKFAPARPADGWEDGTTFYAKFVVDDAQKFGYTVNYYIKGTTAAVPGLASLTGSAPIGEFTWSNVPKTTTGYKLVTSPAQPASMTITAAGPNEKTVFYEVDGTQKFDYTVNYYIKGTTAAVPGLASLTGSAPVGIFTWSNILKTTTGYKLVTSPAQPASMTITAAGPNEKIVYYEIDDTQKFGYTVNYYIKGTTAAVPGLTPLTGSAPAGTFTWSNVSKTTTGYKLVTSPAQPASMTITAAGPNEKIVYYEIDDTQKFGYTVNYYIKGTTTAVPGLPPLTGSVPAGTFTWRNVPKTTTGYKLVTSPAQPASMTITAAGPNEKTVYYEIDNTQKFGYTVNYYIKGTTTAVPGLAPLTGNAPVGEFTWSNAPKTATGYKLVTSPAQPASMTITAAGPNEKTVYYEIDNTQKFGYTVNYYIKGTTAAVPGLAPLTGNAPVGEFTWSNAPKTATGYKLVTSPAQPASMTITAAGPNQKNVYYEIDDMQKFGYKVNYFIKGTTTEVPGLKALTGNAPVGTFTWSNEPKTTTGYKLVTSPAQPASMTITAAGPNVKTVYYEVDDTQKFGYTVNYYIKGTTTAVPGLTPLTGNVPVGEFTWSNAPKTATGYKLVTSPVQPASMTITAAGPNEKTVYYEIDNKQKFGYTVNYYIKGTTTAVPGLTPLTGNAPVGEFTWSNAPKTTTGYKLVTSPAQPASMTITAAGPNEKTVYYEIDNKQKFGYTVNYYIKGTTAAVPGLAPLTGNAPVGEFTWSNAPKTATGYKLVTSPAQPASMTITAAGPNQKNVYYEIDDMQKFGYTVNYFIKGTTTAVPGLKALTGNAPVGTFTWSNAPKTTTGYKLVTSPAQPASMTITAAGPNVKTVYYEVDDTQKFGYTVNYYIKGTTTAVPGLTPLTGNASVGEFTWSNAPKTTTGYKLVTSPLQPANMTITAAGPNEKIVYYEIDDTQKFDYRVNYYIKDTTTVVPGLEALTGSKPVGEFTWSNAPKTATGYKLVTSPAQPANMTITAAGPNEKTVYYEIDETQKFDYRVNYYIKDTTTGVPGLEALTGSKPVGEFTWSNAPKTTTGFKLVAGQPESMTITAAGPNEKTVYYEIDETQKFDYRVNYYIKDTTTGVPGLEALTGSKPVGEFTWSNAPKTTAGYKLMTGQPESMIITAAGPNEKTVYYEIDEDQTLNYKIKYFYNNSEDEKAEENSKVLVADPTVNQVPLKAKAGYKLSDKPYNPELPTAITEENNVINVYYDPVQVNYVVNLYYQVNGGYTEEPSYSYTRRGYTDSEAEVTADDREIKKPGYVFDEAAKDNVLGGTVAGDGSLVLKAYFKQQFAVTYAPGTQGTFQIQKAEGLDYNTKTPEFEGTPTGKPGYVFAGWSPKPEPSVTTDATYTAQWISSTSTKYTVEFYYESKGKYPAQPSNSTLRAGTTDALAAVTDSDKTASTGYILDSNAANVFEAAVAGDGGMVLKVYFKQQFMVTYNPGEHGSFKAQTNTGLSYGDEIPAFDGQTTANGNYSFKGWNKEIARTVTENVVYTALWSYNGSGSSGGSSGSSSGGPRTTGTHAPGGPGDTTVTIEPVPVPLANLPEKTNLVLIDDGNIPLAGLPKTGDRAPVQGVAAIVSGILLAAYLAISHKRRDER